MVEQAEKLETGMESGSELLEQSQSVSGESGEWIKHTINFFEPFFFFF